MPAKKTIPVWKGNTLTLPLRFRTSATTFLDLTGSELVFRASWPGGTPIRYATPSAAFTINDAVGGRATLTLSVADTRSIPQGDVARYEIERRIDGRQETLMFGTLNASEWVNDDV